MKWNNQRSMILTKLCIGIFAILYAVVVAFCPWLVRRFVACNFSAWKEDAVFFMMTIYACAVPLGVILWNLYRLIVRIEGEEIFTESNIKSLRLISWMCFAVAGICLVSTGYFVFYLILAACAVLMGLLLRVLKNVFVRAKEIKEENDYTV